MPTMAEVIKGYITLRDKKKVIKARHSEELAPLNETMYKMEAWIQRELNAEGAESTKTPEGTAYLSTTTAATVEDWNALLNFVQQNDLWGLLEKRVAKAAVEELIESTGELPPGVKVTRTTNARVRK